MKIGILGDIHYVREGSYPESSNIYVSADTRNYIKARNEVFPAAFERIRKDHCDFFLCTGDVIQGYGKTQDDRCDEMRDALAYMENMLGAPVLYTLGTHDGLDQGIHGSPIKAVWAPYMQKTVSLLAERFGIKTENPAEGCYFLKFGDGIAMPLLDYTQLKEGDAQCEALETLLQSDARHIVLFAHAPVYPIFRHGFTREEYAVPVRALLEKYPVDALFCAHTHNQVATEHKTSAGRFVQLQSTIIAYPEAEPLDIRSIFPTLCECEVGFSFQEGTVPSWWTLETADKALNVKWHTFGRDGAAEIKLERGKPEFVARPHLTADKLSYPSGDNDMISVRLCYAGQLVNGDIGLLLNGNPIASPGESSFFSRRDIPLRAEMIGERNTLEVTLPERPCCVGGFVIEIDTPHGIVRSKPSGYTDEARRAQFQLDF